jgi:pimeloyl-ACP methyl ester carboxylesterase
LDAPRDRIRATSPDGAPVSAFRVADSGASEASQLGASERGASERGASEASQLGASGGPPLLLVHGAAADHTTWRTVGPRLATRRPVFAMDRRGRGESGDASPGSPYAIAREYEDVAALVARLADGPGKASGPVDVLGHSYGGRIALGAARRSPHVRRVVAYESAPAAVVTRDGERAAALALLEADLAAGDLEGLLVRFLRDVVGMTPDDLERYLRDPVWPRRVAAAGTIPRELAAEGSPAAGLDAVGTVTVPVLQLVGGASPARFAAAARRLDERLANGRIVVIDGARHAAHHTHPDAFVAAVESFLDER